MYSLPNPAISITGQDSQIETMCKLLSRAEESEKRQLSPDHQTTSSLVQVYHGHNILSVSVPQTLIDGQHQHEQGHTFKRLSVRTK